MKEEFTLTTIQVQDALIAYMEEHVLRNGLGHTFNISFQHKSVINDDGSIDVSFKGAKVNVGDYHTRHKK